MNALVGGGQVELVARLDVEGLVPGIDIPNYAVDPVFAGAVLVGDDLLSLSVLALFLLSCLRVGDEEALIAAEAADHRRLSVGLARGQAQAR